MKKMSGDEDSSPPSVSSTASSRFPLTYLRVLDGLPLPERYLIKGLSHPPVDDLTISEISIPTQTVDRTKDGEERDGGGDDDTDLDASDFEDEVSDFNGTLKGSEEGSLESVYWKNSTRELDTGTDKDGKVRGKSKGLSRDFPDNYDQNTQRSSEGSQDSVIESVRSRTRHTESGSKYSSKWPEVLSEGFKLRRKVRPRPHARTADRHSKNTEESTIEDRRSTVEDRSHLEVGRKANIGYGAPRSESLPTAHVFPSPAYPSSSVAASTSSTSQHWNIHQSTSATNTTTTNFEALREDPDVTFNPSPPYGRGGRDSELEHGGMGGGARTWDSAASGKHGAYTADLSNFSSRHLPPPPSSLQQQSALLASTLPPPQQLRSSVSASGIYDSHLLHGALSSSSHHRQQRGMSPPSGVAGAGASYLPAGYTGWGRTVDYGSERVTAPLADDVTQWQQRHQEQLRRQQLEHTDPLRVGSLSAGQRDEAHYSTIFDPHRLDSIRQAADNIIKEKDQIIDRQKLAILQLEQQGKASEAEMTRGLLKKTQGEVDMLRLKLQEQDYQNARLKARLTEVSTGGSETRNTLERKLGEAEFSLQQLKFAQDQEMQNKDTEMIRLQSKVEELEKSVLMWKNRCGDVQKTCSELQEKKASLERYLHDMPTKEERTTTEAKVLSLDAELERELGRCRELEKQVAEARRDISGRDALIQALETCNSEKEDIIHKLQDEQSKLSVQVQRLQGDGPPLEDDVEELKYKNMRLQADLDKARKLLESHERRHRESLRRREAESRGVSHRLEQEEANVQALKAEVSCKDNDLKKIITSNKKLSKEKQELLERVVALEEKVSSLSSRSDATSKDERRKLERRLMAELSVCFSDLQSLVQICVQRADGRDPNISALLGARASTSASELVTDPGADDTVQSLKYRVAKVRELRDDLDRLREVISNKYAEDMGENLNCATQ